MLRRIGILLAAIMAMTAAAPAFAQATKVENPPEVWHHPATNVAFPSRIGDWVRRDVVTYNEDGSDASVGYYLVRGGGNVATATIYIFPPFVKGDCPTRYAGLKEQVMRGGYQDTRLLSEDRPASPSGRHTGVAYRATFSFTARIGNTPQPVNSQAYIFCPTDPGWQVEARATWAAGADMSHDAMQLVNAIAWPAQLDD